MPKRYLWLLAALLGWPAQASTEAIQECMRDNLPQRTLRQDMQVTSFGPTGSERRLSTRMYAKREAGDKLSIMLDSQAPPDVAGTRYLLLLSEGRETLYVYLPALQRTRRVNGSQMGESLWGTDFSYADIKQLHGLMTDQPLEPLPLTEADPADIHRLAVTPTAEDESPYGRLELDVDADTCLTRQVLFFDHGGTVIKRMRSPKDSFERSGERWIYREVTMEDLKSGTRTRIEFDDAIYDEQISARYFSPSAFDQGP